MKLNHYLTLSLLTLMLSSCLKISNDRSKEKLPSPTPNTHTQPQNNPSSSTQVGSSQDSASSDHQVGNGGGGLCIANSCQTLTESGLEIAGPEEEYYILDPKLARKVNEILNKLPLYSYRKTLLDKIIGQGKSYMLVNIVDETKLDDLRRKYIEMLKKINSNINPDDIHFFAFASENSRSAVTYLLPDFFKLNLDQQVKILIHEANVKNDISYGTNKDFLKEIYEYDGYVHNLLLKPSLLLDSNFRLDRWETLNRHFIGTNSYTSVVNLITSLHYKNNYIIATDEFCEDKFVRDPSYSEPYCYINTTKINLIEYATPALIRFASGINLFYFDQNTQNLQPTEALSVCDEKLKQLNLNETYLIWPNTTDLANLKLHLFKCTKVNNNIVVDYYLK